MAARYANADDLPCSKEVSAVLRKKRTLGMICFFVGFGMLLQFLMPGWGFLIATALLILGFWCVFAR